MLVRSIAAIFTAMSCSFPLPAISDEANSAELFAKIAPVFQSPRCMNCHTVTTFPKQGNDRHRHSMNVARGRDGHGVVGLTCSACHQRENQLASGVPGADEDWRLAPLSMGWENLSVGDLCRRLLDPSRNGGRTGAGVVDHLSTNLVRWAWAPGSSIASGPRTVPPLEYEDFVHAADEWIKTGSRCPD